MAPPLLFDLSQIDLNGTPLFDRDAICEVNPQRHEMQQLDGILWYDKDKAQILGYKDVTNNEFWVRGHVPDRPLMPGVMMMEAGAQLLSFFIRKIYGEKAFVGLGGIESAKFRLVVEPGQRLYLLGHITEFKSRKHAFEVQGIVKGTLVFEAVVIGIRI